MKTLIRGIQALMVAGMLTGCTTPLKQLTVEATARTLLVNGKAVSSQNRNLAEVLMGAAAPHRIGAYAMTRGEEPLVVIDGIVMADGLRAVAAVPAFQVANVEILRMAEAVPRFGSLARNGAIVVRTRAR
ncbi:MAG TPA: hypothetical protein VK864_17040 [Longimicrobiales bacterium]|nr:hypothetical protein [Longimicrobiales bacterium]